MASKYKEARDELAFGKYNRKSNFL
jgi:hypothetical protein